MGRDVLAGRLLLGHADLREVVLGGEQHGEERGGRGSDGDLVELVEGLLVELHAAELVEVETVVDLHARVARAHQQKAPVGRPGARGDVLRPELHDRSPLRAVPDRDVAVQVPEALRPTPPPPLRPAAADDRGETRAPC